MQLVHAKRLKEAFTIMNLIKTFCPVQAHISRKEGCVNIARCTCNKRDNNIFGQKFESVQPPC